MSERADGYRGVWYMNQPQDDAYRYKYSGGFATYPQQIIPHAIYAPAANKTFFVYGGRPAEHNRVCDMASYYDHAIGLVPRPTTVLARQTNDAHYNPTLALDGDGYVYVFCNSHGRGFELSPDDPTYGQAFIYRSRAPHSIDAFECVYTDNFSYSQPWFMGRPGLLWLHTRYDAFQPSDSLLYFAGRDGEVWALPETMSGDWAQPERVG